MELAAPLRWEANGMAAAGRVRILAATDQLADWVLQAPGGEVRAAIAADGPFRAGTAGLPGDARAPWAASAPVEVPAAATRP
jgi:hypothetical protein